MICARCKKNPATIHFKSVLNNQTTQWDLCAPCAQEKGFLTPSAAGEFALFPAPIETLAQLMAHLAEEEATAGRKRAPGRCGYCGLTFAEFQQTSRFGCAHCYDSFAPQVEALLPKIHGQGRHVGKVYAAPAQARTSPPGGGPIKAHEVEVLSRQLKDAVGKEDFEKAAQLRDKIRRLKDA